MPKILFWNIARAGDDLMNDAPEDVMLDLELLIKNHRPDIIVLCEALKGSRKGWRGRIEELGYVAPKFIKSENGVQYGGYRDPSFNRLTNTGKQTTLRYVAMHRNGHDCSYYLIGGLGGGGESRPALLIRYGNRWMVALHAPSVTGQVVPQCTQIKDVYNAMSQGIGVHPTQNGPSMFFGDMNMDILGDIGGAKKGNIMGQFAGHALGQFTIRDPWSRTHIGTGGHSDTTLDWALTAPGFNPTIRVIEPQDDSNPFSNDLDDDRNDNSNSYISNFPKKTIGKKKQPYKISGKKTGYNKYDIKVEHTRYAPVDDFVVEDDRFEEYEEDRKYKPKFGGYKQSDHRPILIEW